MSNFFELLFIFSIAFAGGFSNTTVGGGWFIVFPGLIYRGIQPVVSNATTMFALWSGHVCTSNPIKGGTGKHVHNFRYLLLSCGLGGFLGAFLLVVMPHSIFEHIGPFLLLESFLLFACYDKIVIYVSSKIRLGKEFRYSHSMLIPLFFLGVYGGYFGAGLGMILIILYRWYGIHDNSQLERLAFVLVSVNTGIALLVFICSGLMFWLFVPIMIAGSVLGGYFGILLGKRVKIITIKKVMIGIGALVTLYFLHLVI